VAPACSPSPTAEARPLKRRKSRFESAGEHRAPFSPGGCKPPDCEIGERRREVRVLGSPPRHMSLSRRKDRTSPISPRPMHRGPSSHAEHCSGQPFAFSDFG